MLQLRMNFSSTAFPHANLASTHDLTSPPHPGLDLPLWCQPPALGFLPTTPALTLARSPFCQASRVYPPVLTAAPCISRTVTGLYEVKPTKHLFKDSTVILRDVTELSTGRRLWS